MTIHIIDASVVVKWFVDEDRSPEARALIGSQLAAPDLVEAEAFSALSKHVRRGTLPKAALDDVIVLVRQSIASLTPLRDIIDAGAVLSRRLEHSIYDCLYLALAEREAAELVTADERQFAAARKTRIKAWLL